MKIKRILSAVCAAALALTSITISAFAEGEQTLKDTVIYSGESVITKSWTLGPQVQTANGNGDFDPSDISEGGYFTIDYTGTEGAVYLALAEWNTGTWASVNEPDSTTATETGYRSVFNYNTCLTAFESQKSGSIRLMDIHAICAGTTNSSGTTTITNISWHGYPTEVDLGEKATVLYKGSPSATSRDACLKFLYTKHVGGEWDASQMNEGGYFYAEYNGAKDGLNICLQSHSGGPRWAALTPDETTQLADGRWASKYSYDQIVSKYGTNFVRLDQIQARTNTSEKVVLRRIAYIAGEGAPVDTTDGTWDRPDTGIAFIGDSIVENPRVDTAHLNGIDWNGILGRTDCVNYGIGGQTTKECAARIDEIAKKNYDKVVMLCGINDIGRNYTNDQIAANYQSMFDALTTANPDVQIFLMSVLPTTPVFYTQAQNMIIDLNSALKNLAEKNSNVEFVNIHSAFYNPATGYCKEGITFDGLHPNLTGYAMIADILNPYLNGLNMKIYYQTRNYNSEIRFIGEVNIDAALAAAEAFEEAFVAKSDDINNFQSAYGKKVVTKAYKSLIANGKKITAAEGKCYLISTVLAGIEEGDKVKGEFTIDGTSVTREVKFGPSSTGTGSRVLWEGSGDTGSFANNIDIGVANIPDAVAGGVLTIEYTSTSSRGRSKLQVITSQNPWTVLSGVDGVSVSGGKYDITLTAEQAQQLVDATSILIGGQAAIITKVSYTAPEDVVPPELPEMPELDPIPEGATLLWEGAGDVGKWGEAVKFEGFTNVPGAAAGGKLVFDYFATGTETQLAPAVQIGDALTWTQIPNPNGNTWFDATNNKLVITLNEEQADLYANSRQAWVSGKNAIVRRVYYAPTDVVVDDSSSEAGGDINPPTDGTLLWEKTNQKTGNSASLDWTIGDVSGYEKIVAYATFEGNLMTSSAGGTRVTMTARSASAKVADVGTYLFSKGTSAVIAEIPASTLNGYVNDGAKSIRFALAGADTASEHILTIKVYGV
ncbi:MAG: GDSL-type esterase/lipase family protein, partial [Ruminococcus sp.]|nr:GDSL-type esterase/lipase family protein [Ruminococcus sp.]